VRFVDPDLQYLYRVLPDLAQDDDEGHVVSELTQERQGVGGTEARHIVVGDHHLEHLVPLLGHRERPLHFLEGLYPLEAGA